MRLRKNIAVSESGFIFNPNTGDSYSVNDSALKVFEGLKAGLSEEVIKKELLENLEVTEKQLNEDLEDFIHHLNQLNLLEDG